MKFNTFIIAFIGVIFVGISIGYVMGYYINDFYNKDYLFYLSVPFMGIGCFLSIYGTMFHNKK